MQRKHTSPPPPCTDHVVAGDHAFYHIGGDRYLRVVVGNVTHKRVVFVPVGYNDRPTGARRSVRPDKIVKLLPAGGRVTE
jgi:hypothetical protein